VRASRDVAGSVADGDILRSLYGLFFRILGEVRSKKRDLINTALQLESRM
jgi:hypothetical protein